MGLFRQKEAVDLSYPGTVHITEHVQSHFADIGEHFLDWLGSPGCEQVAPYVDALRAPNGWVQLGQLQQYGVLEPKKGPLTFLNAMTAYDSALLTGWASRGLHGAEKRGVEDIVARLLDGQGHAAAATWAVSARPSLVGGLSFMGPCLPPKWDECVQYVTNGDVVKAFKKWSG